jgi:IMP dehydrogenase
MSAPLLTISAKATVKEAAEKMHEHDISALFVPVSATGIITSTDVVTAVAEGVDPTETLVSDVMTSPVERVTASLPVEEAAAMMMNYGIKHLPVVDEDGDYVGIVSSTDVTSALA